MALSWHAGAHFFVLDYGAAFAAGCSTLAFPETMATIFFPGEDLSVPLLFSVQLYAFMLVVFSLHFGYAINGPTVMTPQRVRDYLVLLLLGDLLHLFVYFRGVSNGTFPGGLSNPGVKPNVFISSYAAMSRVFYLFSETATVRKCGSKID